MDEPFSALDLMPVQLHHEPQMDAAIVHELFNFLRRHLPVIHALVPLTKLCAHRGADDEIRLHIVDHLHRLMPVLTPIEVPGAPIGLRGPHIQCPKASDI